MSASAKLTDLSAPTAVAALHQLVYVSESLLGGEPDAVDAEVALMVAHLRRRNRELGITGALLFSGRHFAQVLEGPEPAVRLLMDRIAADPRHRAITVLEQGGTRVRSFPGWSMARVEPHGDFDWTLLDRLLVGVDREGRQRARSLASMMQYWLLSQ